MSAPPRRRSGRRRGGSGDGAPVVPDATFTSYYGRPVLKPSPWQADIPAYLFLGGVAAGSSLLAAGADLTARPTLRRTGRVGAMVAILLTFVALVHDLGRPSRFVNMLRVAKPTSPMSMGTWVLSAYGPAAGLAGAAEIVPSLPFLPRWLRTLVHGLGRPAGLGAAALAPAVASYTAVLLADTSTPAWNTARHELPFVFVGSAAAASGGLGMLAASVADAGPARKLAVLGAVCESLADQRMEQSMGLVAETLHEGAPGTLLRAGKVLTLTGSAGALVGARSRTVSALAGVALLAGSACIRFAIFEAGQQSARDPKYTVVPQRERLDGAKDSVAR